VRNQVGYEGQAALELEAAADRGVEGSYPVDLAALGDLVVIRHGPMIRSVVTDVLDGVRAGRVDREGISARFHRWLAQSLSETAGALREKHGIGTVALSGGCFQNARLLECLTGLLEGSGFAVLVNRVVPPNDGGISFGQAIVAASLEDS
jgi:hydrogenase maturation protein HypF